FARARMPSRPRAACNARDTCRYLLSGDGRRKVTPRLFFLRAALRRTDFRRGSAAREMISRTEARNLLRPGWCKEKPPAIRRSPGADDAAVIRQRSYHTL